MTLEALKEPEFNEWAHVQPVGCLGIVGHVTERLIAGGSFIRVEIPNKDGRTDFIRFFGTGSIHSITLISKDLVLQLIANKDSVPIDRFRVPKETGG